jgi:hypothetical protein
VLDVAMSEANGTAEREQALLMLRRSKRRHQLTPRTLAADRGYDAGPFLDELEQTEDVVPLGADPPRRDPRHVGRGGSASAGPASAHEALSGCAKDPQAGRRDLRLGQDHRWDAQEPSRRALEDRSDRPRGRRRLQSAPIDASVREGAVRLNAALEAEIRPAAAGLRAKTGPRNGTVA